MDFRLHLVYDVREDNTLPMKVRGVKNPVFMKIEAVFDQTDLFSADLRHFDENNRPRWEVLLTLAPYARQRFREFSSENIGKRLGFVVNGELLCAPVILEEIPDGRFLLGGRINADKASAVVEAIYSTSDK